MDGTLVKTDVQGLTIYSSIYSFTINFTNVK